MMLRKRPSKSSLAASKGSMHISSFFKKTDIPKKRSASEDSDTQSTDPSPSPPAKKPVHDDMDHASPSPASLLEGSEVVVAKKNTAEAKLWAKKLGAGSLGASWMKALVPEFKQPYFTELMEFLAYERRHSKVYPPAGDVFSWTTACDIEDVKVVILGQDPYHGPNQAHGLCFSVKVGVPSPPSLVNMYKELAESIDGFSKPDHGYLMGWAKQGVLLLNACLTVRHRQPNSHAGKGWEKLTDAVIHWINSHCSGVVFLLWGANAQKKGAFINKLKHHVLQSPHPSPLSANRGFFGCGHFKEVNRLLQRQGRSPINWGYLPRDQ